MFYSEADEPRPAGEESTYSGHEDLISQGIDSSASGPSESPQAASAVMQLSGLEETHNRESADIPSRDSESQPLRSNVVANPSITTEPRAADSQQPHAPSRESANPSNTRTEKPTMQRQPRRADTCQRQLLQELMRQDVI